MQRSKVAVSLEVKQVIGTLCRLLAGAGLDHVPTPEAFRRAKFGFGVEMVRLLFCVRIIQRFNTYLLFISLFVTVTE